MSLIISMTRNTYVLLVFMYLLHLILQDATSCAPASFRIALHYVNVLLSIVDPNGIEPMTS